MEVRGEIIPPEPDRIKEVRLDKVVAENLFLVCQKGKMCPRKDKCQKVGAEGALENYFHIEIRATTSLRVDHANVEELNVYVVKPIDSKGSNKKIH